MENLLDLFGLACPRCGNAEALHIAITCLSRVTSDGSEPFGDHDWDHASVCVCPDCQHVATVGDFTRPPAAGRESAALYNHAYDIAFSIETSDPSGRLTTARQLRAAILRRLASLSGDELIEAVGLPFDSYEVPDPAS